MFCCSGDDAGANAIVAGFLACWGFLCIGWLVLSWMVRAVALLAEALIPECCVAALAFCFSRFSSGVFSCTMGLERIRG
ncbi:hypothetical protein Ancab_004557 [Ancistrocladus abbreviatus]